MVHQILDVGVHPLLWWQSDPTIVNLVGSFGQILQRLLNDSYALSHLFHPDQVSVINITSIPYWHLEIEIIVTRIRVILAYVVRNTSCPQHRSRHTIIDCISSGNSRYTNS